MMRSVGAELDSHGLDGDLDPFKGTELCKDLMDLAKKGSSNSMEKWLAAYPGMSQKTRECLRAAVQFSDAAVFLLNASEFKKDLNESDVKFDASGPVSEKSKAALNFLWVVNLYIQGV